MFKYKLKMPPNLNLVTCKLYIVVTAIEVIGRYLSQPDILFLGLGENNVFTNYQVVVTRIYAKKGNIIRPKWKGYTHMDSKRGHYKKIIATTTL